MTWDLPLISGKWFVMSCIEIQHRLNVVLVHLHVVTDVISKIPFTQL